MKKITLTEMVKSLNSKMTKTALLFGFILCVHSISAQVVKTTVNHIGGGDSSFDLLVDFDGAGGEDAPFTMGAGTDSGLLPYMGIGRNNAANLVAISGTFTVPVFNIVVPLLSGLTPGTLIDGSVGGDIALYLNEDSVCYGDDSALAGGSEHGDWLATSGSLYVGVQFEYADGTHYGWIEMNVTNRDVWEVISYAYEQTVGKGIEAGSDISLSIQKNEFASNVAVYNNESEIHIKNLPEEVNYTLYSIIGQAVLQGVAERNDATINVPTLATGMYVLKAVGQESGKVLTAKVLF